MLRAWTLVVLLTLPASAGAADIGNVQVALEDDGVHLSFTLVDAFHHEVLERIRSGLETSFSCRIRIDQERELWFNRLIEEREVRLSCIYDSVGSSYHITKSSQGQVFDSLVVDTEPEMMAAMSRIDRLKIMDNGDLQRNADYVIKVKAELLSRYVLLVVPWDIDTPWREKRFTFN